MIRLPSMSSFTFVTALTLVAGMTGAASAQSTPAASPSDTIRLTDEQRGAVLDRDTLESAKAACGEMVGAFVGSHDSRGIYGTAAVPLGDHAAAVVSFESEQFGRRR